MIAILRFVVAASLVAASTVAQADYLCESKEVEPTAAQKDLFARAPLAMRTAFMAPPDGWVMVNPGVRSHSGKHCLDFKNDPVSLGASMSYSIRPTTDELRRVGVATSEQRKEIAALRKYPPDIQAKLDALNAENTRLRKEAREAEREKNRDLSKAKFAEAQDVSRKAYEVTNQYSLLIAPRERDIYKKYEKELALSRYRNIRVSIEANAAPAKNDAQAERTVLGAASIKTNQATDKLVRISINIARDDKISAAEMEAAKGLIDRAKLQAMLSGSIPSLEESRAAIAQQNEMMARLETKARELERSIELEARRADEAEQIAQRKAAEAERAAKSGKVESPAAAASASISSSTSTSTSTATSTSTTVPSAAAATKPAEAPPATAAAAVPKPPAPPAADPIKDAKDTVNKLRGLLGR